MKILVVEDDSFYAQRIRESLEDRGYAVTVAGSLDAAVQVSLEDYLVVICDVMLPNDPAKSGITEAETRSGFLAGIAFYRFMKKRGDATPFILLSAAGSTGDAGQWAACLAYRYRF